jgi:hypothetical protein
MPTEWNIYRMWHRVKYAVANAGCSSEWLGDWKPTDITFRARSQTEAQKKADRFWREAQFGSGSMICIPADQDGPEVSHAN